MERQPRAKEDVESPQENGSLLLEEYHEASTWDDLEHVGHQGRWRDLKPTPQDTFHP